MRTIKECKVLITWDDGITEDISWHIPENLTEYLDEYLDFLETETNLKTEA